MTVLTSVAPLLVRAADPVPEANDVKAGWVAFWIFVALCVAVGLLGFSLVRHLRRADRNAELGAFDPSDKPRPRQQTP